MGEGTRACEDQPPRKEEVHRYFWKVVDID
jgi:hypothetical protein